MREYFSNKGRIILGITITLCIGILSLLFLYPDIAGSGTYISTKHGNSSGNGVNRQAVTAAPYPDATAAYPLGHCGHCHEMHASVAGAEPTPPTAEGAVGYSVFKNNSGNNAGGSEKNALCYACHETFNFGLGLGYGRYGVYRNKTNYQASVHNTSTVMNWPTLGLPGPTVNDYGNCHNCHNPHGFDDGSGVISSMVFKREENLCNECHDGSPVTTDVKTVITTKTYKHNVSGYTNLHKPGASQETRAYLSANKHVECVDCHNPHVAGATKHTQGTNLVSSVLAGVQGVTPTFSVTNWTAPTQPAGTTVATKEYEICFKCHSSYNTALTTWNANWTDVSLEFSTANQSYHPVVAALPATDPGVNGSSRLVAAQLTGGWTPGQIMYCSDCHGNDAASPAAQGPHGSARAFILKGPNTYWPVNSAGDLYNLGDKNATDAHLAGLFCRNCHPMRSATVNTWYNNVHFEHAGNQGTMTPRRNACISCHILVPHGGKMSRLIGDNNGTMPTRYAYAGTISNMYIRSFTKNTPTGYQRSNCQSASTGCTTHNMAASENW